MLKQCHLDPSFTTAGADLHLPGATTHVAQVKRCATIRFSKMPATCCAPSAKVILWPFTTEHTNNFHEFYYPLGMVYYRQKYSWFHTLLGKRNKIDFLEICSKYFVLFIVEFVKIICVHSLSLVSTIILV